MAVCREVGRRGSASLIGVHRFASKAPYPGFAQRRLRMHLLAKAAWAPFEACAALVSVAVPSADAIYIIYPPLCVEMIWASYAIAVRFGTSVNTCSKKYFSILADA